METLRLPLESIFRQLVQRGLPLSVRDYVDALTALNQGQGGCSRERVKWLCEVLWARTDEERIVIDRLFRDLPPPPQELIDSMPHRERTPEPPTDLGPATEAPGSVGATTAPAVQFAAPREADGVCVPRASVPPALLEKHVLTERPVVGLRSLIVTLRRFRLARRDGPKVQPDIDATMREKCRRGILADVVRVPVRVNHARLLVLFDASPSMAPWLGSSGPLAESLRQAQLGHAAIYYFDNDPADGVFEFASLTRPLSLESAGHRHADCAVLVVSDAGAARGHTDRVRVRSTLAFAKVAQQMTWWPIAWANPMPRKRWTGTSAARISASESIAMFELSEDGLIEAIDHLRGKGRH